MRIEDGKHYRTLEGGIEGPMYKLNSTSPWPWTAKGAKYRYSDTGEPFYPALGDEHWLQGVCDVR